MKRRAAPTAYRRAGGYLAALVGWLFIFGAAYALWMVTL